MHVYWVIEDRGVLHTQGFGLELTGVDEFGDGVRRLELGKKKLIC